MSSSPEVPLSSGEGSFSLPSQQVLTIGCVIRKDLEASLLSSSSSRSSSSGDFLEELERDEKPKPFQINAETVATGRTCVIGSSGSGKSYAVGVLCEELCKAKVPFVLIDIEGEYSGLKEKYDAIWVGEEPECDLKWSGVNLPLLAQYAPDCPALILDLSGVEKSREKVASFLLGAYREISKRRTPYLVILEEADRFVPQVGERLRIFDELARRGRKRGLGLVFCTQRPSVVDKNILSQCANQLIGKLVIRNDLQSVAQFFSSRGLPNQLTNLAPGEFFALGGLSAEPVCVKIRERETRHGGMTPKLNPATVHPSTERILAALSGAPVETVQEEVTSKTLSEEAPSESEKVDLEQSVEPKVEASAIPESIHEVTASVPPAQLPSRIGFAPQIDQNQVALLVKPGRSFKVFSEKENVASVELKFRPQVEAAVTIRVGKLRKKFETQYLLLDGISGQQVESSDRLTLRQGVEKLIGLSEGEILILKSLEAEADRGQSAIELAGRAVLTEDLVRRILKELEEKRLVRSSRLGKAKVYTRLIDLPKVELLRDSQISLTVDLSNSAGRGSFQETKLSESALREIVKGILEGADLASFKVFYYPVYRVELVSKNGSSRTVLIDGIRGKETSIEG
jgi:uncharacterized protein